MASRTELIEAFRAQSRACRELGSLFMASLLDMAAGELEHSGSIAGLLPPWLGDPVADAVPLRLAAALHALVLSGAAPELAAAYPGSGRATDPALVWRRALAAIEAHRPAVDRVLGSPPQTNEVGRSAVLLGGFLQIAKATGGKPMRLLEIGASAGLNQPWDQYCYELGEACQWGPSASPVMIRGEWGGPPPPLDAAVQIAERAASDSAPIDLEDEQARLRLRAYIWADQPARMALLDAAIALARRLGLRVEQGEAAAWVTERLRERVGGEVTILFHSIAWEYFPEDTKTRIHDAIEAAGRDADTDAPFAWLRLEPPAGNDPGAAVLPVDRARGTVLLVRQLRIPALVNGDAPMLVEACAGMVDGGDDPAETVRKESEQELGYRLHGIHKLFTLYMSPGTSAEKLHLFAANYDPGDKVGAGGGVAKEGERIDILELSLSHAWDMVATGEIIDAKTVLLLQHARLNGA